MLKDQAPETTEEGGLLVEAVSLLVQRQREAETWVGEQVWQAEERIAATERRYSDVESRLAAVEAQLARLTHAVEPAADASVEERLTRLREQLEGLKSGTENHSPVAPVGMPRPSGVTVERATAPEVRASAPAAPRAVTTTSGLLDVFGPTPQDRFGILLIAAGAIAVLYALLTQLHPG